MYVLIPVSIVSRFLANLSLLVSIAVYVSLHYDQTMGNCYLLFQNTLSLVHACPELF